MDKRNNDFDFDFTSIGQAIKKAREKNRYDTGAACPYRGL